MIVVSKQRIRGDRIFKAAASGAAIGAALGLLGAIFYALYPEDLANMFLPAARAVLAGRSPYEVYGFYGPPWALAPVLLVAWLPDRLAYAAFAILSAVALGAFFRVRQIAPGRAFPLLLSLPIVASVMYGNLEAFVLLALIVPRPLGLVLLAMKPHMGAVLGLLWVLDAWRGGGARGVARVLWPVGLLTGLSIWVYGFWPAIWLGSAQACSAWGWNVWAWLPFDLWAHVFAVGLPVAAWALHREDQDLAMGAGTLVSPYTSILNLAAWVPLLSRAPMWAVWLLGIGSWILAPLRPF